MQNKLRAKFPQITMLDGQNISYLDSAATAQKPESVIKAIEQFYKVENFPARRSIYRQAEAISSKIEDIRDQISKFLGADQKHQIVFTSGGTESINLVCRSINWPKEEHKTTILTTAVEHNSNLAPWVCLAQEKSANLKVISLPERGFFKFEDFSEFLNPTVKILALTIDSNVIGPVWEPGFTELKKLIERAQSLNILVLLDACQAIAHSKINVAQLNPDFMVFSGHKIGGPTGIGILCIKKNLAESMNPSKVGGGNLAEIDEDKIEFVKSPYKFEAGSLPTAQIIGLGEAINFLQTMDLPEKAKDLNTNLCGQIIDFLDNFGEVKILGNKDFIRKHGHLVSFSVDNIHCHDLAWILGQKGVLLRAGDHCAKLIHRQFNLQDSLRISFFVYSDQSDVERFKKAFIETINFFKGANNV